MFCIPSIVNTVASSAGLLLPVFYNIDVASEWRHINASN